MDTNAIEGIEYFLKQLVEKLQEIVKAIQEIKEDIRKIDRK